jgi:polyhydroxyalkanoate synthesis regulator phasin
MDQDLKQYLDDNFARIDARFAEAESRVNDRIERVETTLLTEFHKWASPAEARVKSHHSAIHSLDVEVEALKQRVAELEKKKAS